MDYKNLQAGQTKDNFWFRSRYGLIAILAKKACKKRRKLKILNIGAGTGDDLEILGRYGRNYVVDIEKRALSVIDKKLCVEKRVADACSLPYKDGFFDVVVSFDVFEHIKDDRLAVSEVYRVLKDDGMLIFTIPAYQFLFSSHDRALQHKRRYSRKDVKSLLSRFDLRLFYWNSLLFVPTAAMRIFKKSSKAKVDPMNMPSWLNRIFYHMLNFDNFLIKRGVSMPVGLSIVGFGFKRK
jgi:SAM-dependent methyltransferase